MVDGPESTKMIAGTYEQRHDESVECLSAGRWRRSRGAPPPDARRDRRAECQRHRLNTERGCAPERSIFLACGG